LRLARALTHADSMLVLRCASPPSMCSPSHPSPASGARFRARQTRESRREYQDGSEVTGRMAGRGHRFGCRHQRSVDCRARLRNLEALLDREVHDLSRKAIGSRTISLSDGRFIRGHQATKQSAASRGQTMFRANIIVRRDRIRNTGGIGSGAICAVKIVRSGGEIKRPAPLHGPHPS
jgi:hypothetical protein